MELLKRKLEKKYNVKNLLKSPLYGNFIFAKICAMQNELALDP